MPHSDEELFAIARRAAKAFGRLPNVHSVGVGGRERGGKPTGEIVLKVFVRRKLPSDRLDPGAQIPESFEGVPTDVVPAAEPRRLALVPGVESLSEEEYWAMADQSRERPLVGGTMIGADTEIGFGTLGFIVEALEDSRVVFGVTNHHVLFNSRTDERAAEVGQPTPSHSCTACCRGVIGKFLGGYHSTASEPPPTPVSLDYALVRLDAGLEWKNEIKDIGVLQETYTMKVSDIVALTYQVRKRGFRTRLTGGIVHAIGVAPSTNRTLTDESIAIRPNPLPAHPTTPVLFATHGDSGSALINDVNQVVGIIARATLLHSSPDPAKDEFGYGWGVPIKWIEDDIKQRLNITMRVLPTAGDGIVNTVPEFAEAGPVLRADTSLERDLDQSEQGREFLRAWLRHSEELNAIVQSQRRVATVWQRHNGTALLRLVARAPLEPTTPLPVEMDGVTVKEGLHAFLGQVDRYASDGLKRDLDRHRALLLSLPGRSYQSVLEQLRRERPLQ